MNELINLEILKPEVQDFIQECLKTDLQKLILKGSPFENISIQELAIQIEGKNKSEKKLPSWFKTKGILFPPKLNLEQASSEITAKYKASLINKGILIDLTGGFGIDDFAFAAIAEKVIHCEINATLSSIVEHNAKILGKENIQFVIGDSQNFLEQSQKVETIYVDPSRRANSSRVFLLEDCEPAILKHQELYLQKAEMVLLKAAPMLDISSAIKSLGNVHEVHVVSLNNECKELLFILKKKSTKSIKYFCVLLKGEETNVYEFDETKEKELNIQPQKLQIYLYVPDAAILKAGFFKSLVPKFGVEKLHQHSHLYTSSELKADFPGKIFKVMATFDFSQFTKAKALSKANLVTRNFQLKPEEIKKQFKIKDGGEDFLFFTTDFKNKPIVIQARKI